MNSTRNQMTAQIPSGFGMPTCGHAFTATTGLVTTTTGVFATVVRDSQAVIAGRLGHAQKSFPWTTAWRPPRS